MAIKVLMLNPKAVKMFAAGTWEANGKPTPLVMVTGRNYEVELHDAISGTYIGNGHLSGTRSRDGDQFFDANTSNGVRPQGKGYGLALYCGLALLARQGGSAGVSSPDGGGAVDLWDQMVENDLAEHDTEGNEEHESTDIKIDLDIPTSRNFRRHAVISYEDVLTQVRENLDIPDSVADDDIEIEVSESEVEVPVEVSWKSSDGGYFLKARSVHDSGLIVGGFDTDRRVRLDIKDSVPADLIAAIPIKDSRSLRTVVHLLRQLGRDTSVEQMMKREDIAYMFQSEGKQMMIPGVPAHYPRPAAWKTEQVPLPGMSGLGGRRGLGALPRGLALSARAQGILHRFGNID